LFLYFVSLFCIAAFFWIVRSFRLALQHTNCHIECYKKQIYLLYIGVLLHVYSTRSIHSQRATHAINLTKDTVAILNQFNERQFVGATPSRATSIRILLPQSYDGAPADTTVDIKKQKNLPIRLPTIAFDQTNRRRLDLYLQIRDGRWR
jgi:hypothetical protein